MAFSDRNWDERPVRTTFLGLTVGWLITLLATLGVLVIVVVVWALTVGFSSTYSHGEQIKQDNRYSVTKHSQAYQQGVIDAERDYATSFLTSNNAGQKKQIAITFCAKYSELTQPPSDLVTDYSQMCK